MDEPPSRTGILASPEAASPPARQRPSWQGRLVNLLLRVAVRRSLGRRGIEELPAMRARLDRMGMRLPTPRNVVREQDRLDGVDAEWTRVAGVSDPRRTVFYLHGGAFIVGSPRMYRGLLPELAQRLAAEVVAIDYRLAPEHPFPAALQDAEAAYRHLLARGQAPEHLLVIGDSAGGNLTLALLQKLRNSGLPMPAAAAVLSPWLDLGATYDPNAALARRDPMLPAARIAEAAALYHGATLATEPLVSPLHLDFAGLPPLLVQSGGQELLLPAIQQFAARARAAGAPVALQVWPGMPHVFQAFARIVPEAREALDALAGFAIAHVPADRVRTVAAAARDGHAAPEVAAPHGALHASARVLPLRERR